ncbi:hypothetical protein GCM10025868_43670 [Angustibacter aerolatus]|uniref:Uncharacterized protein n=1 Tax=Angustibacter aerolatus TaxID=1162965 RepID=A0ABQ6JQJ5_9ACTN|nr:hypothetical protein GCM10025868_43670 [Angustibacter aerolatus]
MTAPDVTASRAASLPGGLRPVALQDAEGLGVGDAEPHRGGGVGVEERRLEAGLLVEHPQPLQQRGASGGGSGHRPSLQTS